MADPKGFIKVNKREVFPNREECERLKDFDAVESNITAEQKKDILTKQASRCMDCGVPFCHFSCPLGNLIPEFNDFVYHNNYLNAYDRLVLTNNFPEFTGRVCPALCESGCVLGSIDPAVTIENIEKSITDFAFDAGFVQPKPPANVSGKSVAIIGSGPAGLAAAQQLCRSGHTVVVYEKDNKLGGLLRYGIPNFKLEKWIIDRRLDQLSQEGVQFITGAKVGSDSNCYISVKDLLTMYDSVLITTGTQIPNDLKIEGRELNNVHFAMDYLKQFSDEIDSFNTQINARDKNVLIVGGGDTGSDCLGSALRQGANKVTTLQILTKPPQTRSQNNPWPTYPNIERLSTSQKEGIASGKSEYLWETTVTKLIGDTDGNVTHAQLSPAKFVNGTLEIDTDFTQIIPVDLVLISVGFKGVESDSLLAGLDVEISQRNTINRDQSFMTNVKNLFVAGDASRGQSLVVWAIAEGRSAAANIDQYLMGETELSAPISPTTTALN